MEWNGRAEGEGWERDKNREIDLSRIATRKGEILNQLAFRMCVVGLSMVQHNVALAWFYSSLHGIFFMYIAVFVHTDWLTDWQGDCE